ncbi:MAG: aromatic ring-hydroxylating oxygenase subunit alpha [Pseudomonadales bacterium]
MSHARLIEIARTDLAHGRNGTMDQTDSIYKVPVETYYDNERWKIEMKQIFRRLPLMLATTSEVREVGDYKTIDAAGVQVLITRTKSGQVKAFVNMCTHRGACLVGESRGRTYRFTCPYHAWTFSPDGDLVAVYAEEEFGDLDKSQYGLTELPCLERAGLIWVTLNPKSTLDIETFLCGYDSMLAQFGFDTWHLQATQVLEGPNWKVAYDGYLDYYHLPILHGKSFGTDIGHKANYYFWGPHSHLGRPDTSFEKYENLPDKEWPLARLLDGVWTIFPHISIASFQGGGRSVMISQLFPGETIDKSTTVQYYLMEKEPLTDDDNRETKEQFDFLKYVVSEEDYKTGIALQKNLEFGALDHVLYGKNEGGSQSFHKWVEAIVNASDDELPKLFQSN